MYVVSGASKYWFRALQLGLLDTTGSYSHNVHYYHYYCKNCSFYHFSFPYCEFDYINLSFDIQPGMVNPKPTNHPSPTLRHPPSLKGLGMMDLPTSPTQLNKLSGALVVGCWLQLFGYSRLVYVYMRFSDQCLTAAPVFLIGHF